MSGQGSPTDALRPCRALLAAALLASGAGGERVGRMLALVLLLLLLGSGGMGNLARGEEPEPLELEIRLQWMPTAAARVTGSVEVDRGEILDPQNLSLEAGTTGAFQLQPGGRRLRIAPRGTAKRAGVQLRVRGDAATQLTIRLATDRRGRSDSRTGDDSPLQSSPPAPGLPSARKAAADAGTDGQCVLRLGDLVRVAQRLELTAEDGSVVRLWVDRAPGDHLRVDLGRSALVFWAGETVPLRIQPNATGAAPGQSLDLRVRLNEARGGTTRWERTVAVAADAAGRLEPIALEEVALPEEEGVYEFAVALLPRSSSTLGVRWRSPEPLAKRVAQLVVLQRDPPPADTQPMQTILQMPINSRSAFEARWIASGRNDTLSSIAGAFTQLPGVGGALGGRAGETVLSSGPIGEQRYGDQTVGAIAPGGWIARSIPVTQLGRPHRLVLRYPADRPVRLAVSILEPDAAGRVTPLGTDSGVADDAALVEQRPGGWGQHELLFWPRTARPVLVLSNLDNDTPARIASLQVEAGPRTLPRAEGETPPDSSGEPDAQGEAASAAASVGPGAPPGRRLAALYLDKPLLSECFGVDKAYDPQTDAAIEDWVTFLDAGRRLVQYLHHAGYNGAIVTVGSEGGTLYPTELMQATPRFDNGIFASEGRDPVRKDVLELLLRLFDREGLRLIPAIELATPLTELESLLASAETNEASAEGAGSSAGGSSAAGIEWVDPAGRRHLAPGPPSHGMAPYYNPLDERVGGALRRAVDELATRYAGHPSLAGIGLHLGPQTYVQLPGARWGFDERTLAAFAADSAAIPAGIGVAAWAEGEGRSEFIRWRADRMTALYRDLAASAGPHPLLLLTADHVSPGRRESDHLEIGLHWSALAADPSLVPMRLYRNQPLAEPVQRIDEARLNEDVSWDRHLASAHQAGGLVYRPPTERRLDELARRGPWGEQSAQVWLFAHGVPAAERYRRSLTRVLNHFDAEVIAVGGWTPPLGQEDAARQTLRTFASLPAGRFENSEPADAASAAVRVRWRRQSGALYVYAVNTVPWPVTLEVSIRGAAGAPLVALGAERSTRAGDAPAAGSEGRPEEPGRWRAELPAGGLAAIRVEAAAAEVAGWTARPVDEAALVQRLHEHVQELARRLAVLGRPRPYPELRNGDFEQAQGDILTDWLVAQHPPQCVRVGPGRGEDSRAAVMENDGRGAASPWMLSSPLRPPATGRLAVSLHAQARSEHPSVQLRVSLEGRLRGAPWRRSTVLKLPAGESWPDSPDWLRIDDLPGEELEELRLTLDLLTPGRVVIDDIALYDFFLTDDERSDLQRETFLAVERMRRGDLTAAARLVDSHWGRHLLRLQMRDEHPASGETTGSVEPPPRISRRLRDWLTNPLRF